MAVSLRPLPRGVACLALLACSCSAAAPAPVAAPTADATQTGTAAATGVPRRTFPPGIYVSRPFPDRPGGEIELLAGGSPLPARVAFNGIGFDVSPDAIVSTDNHNFSQLNRVWR